MYVKLWCFQIWIWSLFSPQRHGADVTFPESLPVIHSWLINFCPTTIYRIRLKLHTQGHVTDNSRHPEWHISIGAKVGMKCVSGSDKYNPCLLWFIIKAVWHTDRRFTRSSRSQLCFQGLQSCPDFPLKIYLFEQQKQCARPTSIRRPWCISLLKPLCLHDMKFVF